MVDRVKAVKGHFFKVIILMSDLSGGLIRLSDVCNVNVALKFENFEVSLFPNFKTLDFHRKPNIFWLGILRIQRLTVNSKAVLLSYHPKKSCRG
jgi:hypothetical protein